MANEQSQAVVQQEMHPLCKISIPRQLAPFAQAFAEPLATFRQCFPSNKEADMAYLQQVEYAMQAMQANTYLIQCAQKSPTNLINSLKQVALSGLSLSPVSKLGYLVPFKGDITFMASYMGLRDLLVKTGLVKNVEAHLVYPDDFFEISYGLNGHLIHKPSPFSKLRKKEYILGGYFIVEMSSGVQIYDTMSIEEINDIYKRSPSYGKQSPWLTDFGEMAKKTLIRRAFKSIPHTSATPEQMKVIELAFENDDKFFYDKDDSKKRQTVDFEEVSVMDKKPKPEPQQQDPQPQPAQEQ